MTESILSIVGITIAIISITIVVYDHFKDDRILTRQVHEFYHYIEGLIYTQYLMEIDKQYNSQKEKLTEVSETFSNNAKKWSFYRGKISQLFETFSRYLGLTYYTQPNNYIIENYDYFIEQTGYIMNFHPNSPTEIGSPQNTFYNNPKRKIVIDDKAIEIINEFLKRLRFHWNNNFSKFLFRKKIKSSMDFESLRTPEE